MLFVSYSGEDREFARLLADDLQRAGVNVWLDTTQLRVGEGVVEGLPDAIRSADSFAVVLSPDAIASPWVKRELGIAMSKPDAGQLPRIIPILYRPCELPRSIRGYKYVDFSGRRDYSEGFQDLLLTLGLVAGRAGSETADLLRSLSGIWVGAWTFAGHPRVGKLYIEATTPAPRATARISSFRRSETLLEESFEIEIQDNLIRLVGTGYRFLRRGTRKGWYLDTFELRSKERGTVLAGTRFDTEFPRREPVVFRREAELDQGFRITPPNVPDSAGTPAARLDGKQIESLRDALCSAFDQDSLDEMLRFRLNKDREKLVGSGSLRRVILKLILLAEREGWVSELIRAARGFNPGSPELRRFCAQHSHFELPQARSPAPG
ncbi:MAG TPA: TIR domain-containing protein [Gemmataceae bacterium]|nr:TIR domain-containing protein [Gemmataceae bacterium]